MTIEEILIGAVQEAVKALYGAEVTEQQVQLQKTKAEFEGHLTVVVFPFVKAARKSPEQVGTELGQYLTEHVGDVVAKFNVVKGFLNLVINDASWITLLNQIHADIGLMTAAAKYHYSFKTRFSTYSYSWILQYMLRYLYNKTSMITLPHRKEKLLRKIVAAKN